MWKEIWMDDQSNADFAPPIGKKKSTLYAESEKSHPSLAFSAAYETKIAFSLDTDYTVSSSIDTSIQQVHVSGHDDHEHEKLKNNDIVLPEYSYFSHATVQNDYPIAFLPDPNSKPDSSLGFSPESSSKVSCSAFHIPQQGYPSYKDNALDPSINLNDMFYKLHLKYSPKEKFAGLSKDLNVQIKSNSIEENCLLIVPLIQNLTPRVYVGFLADIMTIISDQISLEEFYDLLHHSAESHFIRFISDDISKRVFSVEGKSDASKICSFILHMFKQANGDLGLKPWESGESNHPRSVFQYDEFLRTFLAVKIILDSIIEVGAEIKENNTIPRILVYKVYQEICQDLSNRFKTLSQPSKFHTNTAIGLSRFGIIINTVHPNWRVRRLGSRGKSRPHYQGVEWNTRLVDSDLLQRAELNTGKTYTSSTSKTACEAGEGNSEGLNRPQESKSKIISGNHSSIQDIPRDKSLYSFVSKQSKLPKVNCSLRVSITANKLPEQSDWSKITMLRAVNRLQKYNLDMMPVVQDFQQHILSPLTPNTFYMQFVDKMATLIKNKSDIEGYKTLYLTVLLLLFPFVLASDEEIRPDVKTQFRQNLTNFVNQSRMELFQTLNFESNHFINFLNIIRKMIRINEMLSLQVSNTLLKSITKEVSSILQELMISDSRTVGRPLIEETILQAVFMALQAFKFEFADPFSHGSEKTTVIASMTAVFAKICYSLGELIIGVLESASSQDPAGKNLNLPFHMFHKVSQHFHELCLSESYLSQLPIQVISFIYRQINKEIQQGSLRHFSRRNIAVSSETFKTWWIYTTISEEYLQVLAETIALSEIVADN